MRPPVCPISLRDVYAQAGEYSVKFIIDPALSPQFESVVVDVRNSDGRPMSFTFKRWGTKLTVGFVIDSGTPDGVSVIDVLLRRPRLDPVRQRFGFWVIKD